MWESPQVLGEIMVCEQRRHVRVPFCATAVVVHDGARVGEYEVRDLSFGGAFLAGSRSVDVGARVLVMLEADQFGMITLEAQVVRCTQRHGGVGLGIEFFRPHSHIEELIVEAVLTELGRAPATALA